MNTRKLYRLLFWVVSCLIVPTFAKAQLDTTFDIQGHRGARGLLPENSIIGFLKALDCGVTTLEMDVVMTADSQVVVSHEPWMNLDICSSTHKDYQPPEKDNIYKMTYERVTQFDCGSMGNSLFPTQTPHAMHKPLLAHVINAVEDHIRSYTGYLVDYNIEIKSTAQTDRIYHPEVEQFSKQVYETISPYISMKRVIIQSFDLRILRYWNQTYPDVRLSLLVENNKSFEQNVKKLGVTPSIYSPFYKQLKAVDIDGAHKKNIRVIPWTVNELSDMVSLKERGVDGIITDFPDRAAQVYMTKDSLKIKSR